MSSRILIIEDEAIVRQNVVDFLTLEGYEVRDTDDGYEGVEIAKTFQPDLILCDVMMPQVDGYNVLVAMQAHQKTATIPFIFLTAMAERSDRRMGMELGADDYLIKPFSFEELLQAIRTRLQKRVSTASSFDRAARSLYGNDEAVD